MLMGIAKPHEVKKRLDLPTGSSIFCRSAESEDNLRGEGVDFMVIDEAAHIRKLPYLWMGVLRPMLIDTSGSMLALSTPNRKNLFHRWYLNGQDPLKTDWQSWNFSTHDNPHLPSAELDELLQEYPPGSELYRQEILGEFLESGGQVFRKVREAATAPQDAQPDKAAKYYGGVDWGQSHDFTVAYVLDADGNMVAGDRFNTVDYVVQRQRIAALHDRWKPQVWAVEVNAMGTPNAEMLERDGLPVQRFTTTASSKRPLIEGLAQAFELGRIQVFDDPVLIGELEAYERKVSSTTGAPTYSAPDGLHDDCVMALALAWYARQHGGPAISFI